VSYLVGENRPELFTPGSSGNITPNGKWGVAGGTTVFNIDARQAQVSQEIMRAIKQSQDQTVGRAIVGVQELNKRH
jgi:hypothetical protein